MTPSKLSLLQDLFGDNILTWQHFFFIEKRDVVFLKSYVILCALVILLEYQVLIRHNAIPPCVINMKILFHVWNLILFKGQKYH